MKGKSKSAVDDVPSALILSVDVIDPEYHPPSKRTSPDRSCQQRWCNLCSVKVTDKTVNVPSPSNREQDLSACQPPQAMFPHKVKPSVAFGMSPI